jgi:hypothetical protein
VRSGQIAGSPLFSATAPPREGLVPDPVSTLGGIRKCCTDIFRLQRWVTANRVQKEFRVVITLDLDFAHIQAYPPGYYAGIVGLRSKTQGKATVVGYVRNLIGILQHRSPSRELWIVQRDRVRFAREGGTTCVMPTYQGTATRPRESSSG